MYLLGWKEWKVKKGGKDGRERGEEEYMARKGIAKIL